MAYDTYSTSKINNIKFTQGFRGYDTVEVDEFLDEIVKEIEKLNSHIKNLKEDLAREKRKSTINEQEIQRLERVNSEISSAAAYKNEEVSTPEPKEEKAVVQAPEVEKQVTYDESIDEMKNLIAETLLSAKRSAERVIKDAENKAEDIIEDAERRARERVVSLKAEIVESEQKLGALYDTVNSAKEKYIKAFQTQIAEINKIAVGNDDIPTEYFQNKVEEVSVEEIQQEEVEVEIPEVKVEKKQEPAVKDIEEPAAAEKKFSGDIFSKLPKPPSSDNKDADSAKSSVKQTMRHGKDESDQISDVAASFEVNSVPRAAVNPYDDDYEANSTVQPENSSYANEDSEVNTDNQQYIELALSKYNDNKYHNKKYPNTNKDDIRINNEDEESGIFQPEDRSILSSVIEDILNNKKND